MDQQTIDTYRARAAEYDAIPFSHTLYDAMQAFAAHLPQGGHILDLGCGPGQQAAHFQSLGFQVSGLDATPEFVAAAQARGIDARLGCFDDLTEAGVYDGIWASFSLLHAPRDAFARHLAAAARALRPGGPLFLGMKKGQGEVRDAIGRLYTYYTVQDLHNALADLGLRVVHQRQGRMKGMAGTVDPFVLLLAKGS